MDAQREPTRRLERIATPSHGIVTRQEALAAGLSAWQVGARVRSGLLLVEYPGVYRLGHRAPSLEARYLAAVKACGPGALLAGLAAAHLFSLLEGSAPPPEVICPGERRIAGVTTRRARRGPRHGTTWRGVPTTTVQRTLVDIAVMLGESALAKACHEAAVQHGVRPALIEQMLKDRPTAPGAARLRRVIRGDVPLSLSRLEARFLSLLREHDLPLPETNEVADSYRVDCRWPRHRLTVELDSYRYHGSRHAWERDRKREREAYARGDEFRRYTYGDVIEQPGGMLDELVTLLSAEVS